MATEANEAMEQQAPTPSTVIYPFWKGMADPSSLCWFLVAILFSVFTLIGFFDLSGTFHHFPVVAFCVVFVKEVIIILSLFFIGFSYVNGRHKPRRLLGCHVKLVYNLIIVCTAITVRKFHGYDDNVVLAMVGFNGEFHALAKLWNISDIGFLDMLLGVLMQIVIFFMGDETYVFIVVMMLCGGIIYYHYWSYSTPTTCVLPKEDDLKNPNRPV